MKLTEETKQKIIDILDSKEFMEDLYAGLDPKKREELGQFYTPAKICIQMIEKFNCDSFKDQNILDPTVGSGNLLIACLIAGADSDKVFGNEYDGIAVKLCRKRINRACDILGIQHIRDWQIHQGNALQARCLIDFSEEYSGMRDSNGRVLLKYNPEYIDDLEYAQTYDHDIEEEILGTKTIRHEVAKSWRWENERARKRAAKKARLEAEKLRKANSKQVEEAEPISLF